MKIKFLFNLLFLGMLTGFSQSFFYLIPLVVLAYFFFYKKIILAQSLKESFFTGWIFGTGFFFGSMHWMVNPFLIYQKHFLLFPLGLIVFPIVMGLFFVIPTVSIFLTRKTKIFKEKKIFLQSFFISFFFFVSEFLRSKIFGGLPFNLSGHMWALKSDFIQISKFVGVYGISFLTLLWIMVSINLFNRKNFKLSFFMFVFFPTFFLSFSFLWNSEDKKDNEATILVRVVQPNISQEKKWNRLFFQQNIEKLVKLTNEKNSQKDKIVVWPEAAITLYLNEEKDFLRYLKKEIPSNISIITGGLRREISKSKVRVFNSLYLINEKIKFYDKRKLVPFGEFIPLRKWVDFLKITPGSTDFSAGQELEIIKDNVGGQSYFFEPSICFEAIFQTFSDSESQFLINVTNDAWFGNGLGPRQHLSAQIFRAVEKSTPLIRSSNSGISVITNEKGKIVEKIKLGKDGFIELDLKLQSRKTFFEKNGNLSLVFLILLTFLLFYLIDIIYHLKIKSKSYF
tara:strand:+ start:1355 stop:2884 length:1530 start_codon:yes stop_codon:yes gene_type:complete